MKALVYGVETTTLEAIPALLGRAGFSVDVITVDEKINRSKQTNAVTLVSSKKNIVAELLHESRASYQLYIPTDDQILSEIKNSPIAIDKKISLLAIIGRENLAHIYSKIGLAEILGKNQICSPEYKIAVNQSELLEGARVIGFPVMVKIDCSGAGEGTHECHSAADVEKLSGLVFPVLIQKKIEGDLLDLSGFYQQGKLVHFSCSNMIGLQDHQFGPSCIRKYVTRDHLHPSVAEDLSKLGVAIGANGFVNTTCIKNTVDGRLYFIEADMRPNVWVEHARYFGDDPAYHIRNYFERGQCLSPTSPSGYPSTKKNITMAYLPRMDTISILLNRHNCWHHYENYLEIPHVRQRLKLVMSYCLSVVDFRKAMVGAIGSWAMGIIDLKRRLTRTATPLVSVAEQIAQYLTTEARYIVSGIARVRQNISEKIISFAVHSIKPRLPIFLWRQLKKLRLGGSQRTSLTR